jgi:hypothetical protein
LNSAKELAANHGKDDAHAHAPAHAHALALLHSPAAQCTCVDPITYIQSPPCKQIAFCESETVYAQKLQDLIVLDREAARIDEELNRVKMIKEAETARRILLHEKVKDLYAMIDSS